MPEPIRETAKRLLAARESNPERANSDDDVAALCHAVLAAPQWHAKPTGPGWWVVRDRLCKTHHMPRVSLMHIADGADMETFPECEGCCVYGPIPEGSDHA